MIWCAQCDPEKADRREWQARLNEQQRLGAYSEFSIGAFEVPGLNRAHTDDFRDVMRAAEHGAIAIKGTLRATQ